MDAPAARGPALRLWRAYSARPPSLPVRSHSSFLTVARTQSRHHEHLNACALPTQPAQGQFPGHRRLRRLVTVQISLVVQASQLGVVFSYTNFDLRQQLDQAVTCVCHLDTAAVGWVDTAVAQMALFGGVEGTFDPARHSTLELDTLTNAERLEWSVFGRRVGGGGGGVSRRARVGARL